MNKSALALSLLTCSFLWLGSVRAEGVGADVRIVMHAGDALDVMVERMTGSSSHVDEILRHNNKEPGEAFGPGETVVIPGALLRKFKETNAEVLFVKGEVTGTTARGQSIPMAVGTRLVRGDTLRTGPGATANLRLMGYEESLDHDHMLVGENSEVELTQMLVKADDRNILLKLLDGALQIVTSHSDEKRRMIEVETPTAIGGVRGTNFRVAVEGGDSGPATRSEALDGTVMFVGGDDEIGVGAGFGSRVREAAPPTPPKALLRAPGELDPIDGAKLEAFAFRWGTVQGAVRYVLEIAEEKEFTHRHVRAEVEDASYAPTVAGLSLREAPYYWRVSSIDEEGFQGEPSPPRAFVVARP